MEQFNDLTYLRHILQSIGSIEDFLARGGRSLFDHDKAIQNAIIRELEIIGEACRNVSDSFRQKHPGVPWRKIVGARDKLIHDYLGVDLDRVWNMATIYVPELKKQILEILGE
ncbi:DUF86 domain-containing protein [Candidatus Amesbacteria bacterium]|nr:DUF86 domain-containing protein [Candidatus Amesbacteria bacterium]